MREKEIKRDVFEEEPDFLFLTFQNKTDKLFIKMKRGIGKYSKMLSDFI